MDARVPKEEIGPLYDRTAPVYDLWARLTETRARDRAIELAAIEDGESFLEVAVGTGTAFCEIVRRNPNGTNVGIDLSPGMLAKAKRRLGALDDANYTLETGTAFDLKVDAGSVDLLMNSYMFDLLTFEDMDRVLEEFRRVLKEGGRFVLVTMTKGQRFGSGIYDRIFRISPRLMGGCRGIELTERLQNAGFAVELREYRQQMLFPSEVILARK